MSGPVFVVQFVVYQDGDPDADLLVASDQRREGDPSVVAAITGLGDPANCGGDASALGEGLSEFFPYPGTASDLVCDGRLKDSGDLERRGGEEDTKRGVRSDEKVLELSIRVT